MFYAQGPHEDIPKVGGGEWRVGKGTSLKSKIISYILMFNHMDY